MQDQRDLTRITTYIAEAGKTVDRDGTSYLQLSKGVLLRPQSAGNSAMVTLMTTPSTYRNSFTPSAR